MLLYGEFQKIALVFHTSQLGHEWHDVSFAFLTTTLPFFFFSSHHFQHFFHMFYMCFWNSTLAQMKVYEQQ